MLIDTGVSAAIPGAEPRTRRGIASGSARATSGTINESVSAAARSGRRRGEHDGSRTPQALPSVCGGRNACSRRVGSAQPLFLVSAIPWHVPPIVTVSVVSFAR